jgi:hypothetical protein
LPQLVYSSESESAPAGTERWAETGGDPGTIDWKLGLRALAIAAVLAGLMSSEISPFSALGVFWVAGAAAWAVVSYARSRPVRITIGAGARIGLVTGLIAGWIALSASGANLFIERAMLHRGNEIEATWKEIVVGNEQKVQQVLVQAGATSDDAQKEASHQRDLLLSPEGHAGFVAATFLISAFFMVLFAAAGGALSARSIGKRRALNQS